MPKSTIKRASTDIREVYLVNLGMVFWLVVNFYDYLIRAVSCMLGQGPVQPKVALTMRDRQLPFCTVIARTLAFSTSPFLRPANMNTKQRAKLTIGIV